MMLIVNTQLNSTYIITGFDMANMFNRSIIILVSSIVLGSLFGGIGAVIKR